MTNDELKLVLEKHRKWLTKEPDGERAELVVEDLHGATLRNADLREASLYGAYLSGAVLRGADLLGADMRCADLSRADLRGADLRGANLDFSCWPLWCGSLDVKIDKRIACQLLYHVLNAMQSVDNPEVRAVCNNPDNIALANQFHLADECGKIEPIQEDK